jgi:ATP-binding cassette ChvD family protein
MSGLTKHINGKQIIKETYLSFLPGAKIGIIGHNGAGKSTLLRIMAGIDKEYDGEAWAAENTKIGYLEQEPKLDLSKNVLENIMEGPIETKAILDEFNLVNSKFGEEMSAEEMDNLLQRQTDLQDKIEALGAWDFERDIEIAMDALRCPPKEATIQQLSGGEKRRVALCKLLLSNPDLLLLDEPTNHLDAESVSWVEKYLKNYKGTVVIVTHDRYFLDNVTEWMLEINAGSCIPWHTNYTSWLREKLKQKESGNEDLMDEFNWLTKSDLEKKEEKRSRIVSYSEKFKQKLVASPSQITLANGPRLGDLVIQADKISMKYGDRILYSDFSFNIPAGAIVGIIGPNGAGKTTLFNIITGKQSPSSGSIKIGSTVQLSYVDQSRDNLDPNKTVWEEISDELEEMEIGDRTIKTRAYCSFFSFKGSDQQKKVGVLSGGERGRVHIAKMLKSGGNVILLDEPSNDLDIGTLRALEEAIRKFAGCIMVISHDRWFLDRVATHLIVFDQEHGPSWFEGNYQDYCEHMLKYHNIDVSNPEYKHKKLSR